MSHGRRAAKGAALAIVLQTAAVGVAVPVGTILPVPAGAQEKSARKVRLDFVKQDINVVAKALSIQSGVNVVLMPSVKGEITVRLVDLTVDEALKKVAAAVGADVRRFENTYFVGSPAELKAQVAKAGVTESVFLRHTPATEIKELVAKSLPYVTADAVGNSIVVVSGSKEDVAMALKMAREADIAPPPGPPAPEPAKPVMVRETYPVKFMKAPMLAEAVGKAVPEIKVQAVENSVVVEGFPNYQAQVAKLITILDVQGAQERSVRSVSLKYSNALQVQKSLEKVFPNLVIQPGLESYSPAPANLMPLSIEGTQSFGQQSSGGGGGQGGQGGQGQGGAGGAGAQELIGPGSRSRTVILSGPAADVDQASQVISALDVAPQQVSIEARVVDITPDSVKQLGFTWDFLPFSTGLREATTPGKLGLGTFTRGGLSLDVDFDALERNRHARILARPNISVVDGEESSIFIGDILRYERLSSITDTGQTFTIETVPVGVALLCRPRIAGNDIILKVHPVVSNVTGFTGRNRDIPITASREADSTIKMKDGETIAIGGLLREEETKILTKVPFLGDLPFFGNLFRHRNTTKRKSEVTIFLTARIMKDAPM